ncbi:MAG TPA: RsmB/NOP family class I SAM-dependent RNA methyltransferase [Vulgatibacter sp.]|nr:RsmB/NOP family class I SAM-dependent RNA methyltransferase [Vulgatibacter sp.]
MAAKRGVKAGRPGGRGTGRRFDRKSTRAQLGGPAEVRPRPLREDLVRALALEALAAIRDEGRVADRTLDHLLHRERRLYAAERRAVAEAVYGLLRAEGRLHHVFERTLGGEYLALSPAARRALWYEALRAKERGVDPARALAEAGLSAALLPGLDAFLGEEPVAAADAPVEERIALEEGLPTWMTAIFVRQLGEEGARDLAAALNERAPLTIRANRLHVEREALARRLEAEGVASTPTRFAADGLHVEGRVNLFGLPSFREGLFEIQDEGSQLLAALLDPRPGWLTIDACAGAGGKTLALAASMRNKGRLVALDVDGRRLSQLGPRARRAGVHNWEAHVVPEDGLPAELSARLSGKADAVLVDAPCTGLGVLRRNPDARHRLDEGSVARFASLQRALLHRYASLAKPGGRIVYATCSVAAEENEEVVEAVLAERPDLEFLPPSTTLGEELAERLGAGRYLRLLPHVHGTDGFFAALLRRR